jgi:hypothetical protein
MKRFLSGAVLTLSTITLGYGGVIVAAQSYPTQVGRTNARTSRPSPPIPQLAGAWEMIMTVNDPSGVTYGGPTTRLELGLTQQHSSAPSRDFLTGVCPASMGVCGAGIGFGPAIFDDRGIVWTGAVNDFSSNPFAVEYSPFSYCNLTQPNSVAGTVDPAGKVTLSIGGTFWTASGSLQANGSIAGKYKFGTPSCSPWGDGTFIAARVNSLSGDYGNDILGNSSLKFAVNESSTSDTLPVIAHVEVQASDSANGTYTLSGQAYSNFVAISGEISGQTTNYWGLLVQDINLGPLLVTFDDSFQVVSILRKMN